MEKIPPYCGNCKHRFGCGFGHKPILPPCKEVDVSPSKTGQKGKDNAK